MPRFSAVGGYRPWPNGTSTTDKPGRSSMLEARSYRTSTDGYHPAPSGWPLVHGGSVTIEGHQRHAMAARVGDPVHFDHNDRPHSRTFGSGKVASQLGEVLHVRRDGSTLPSERTMRGSPLRAQNIATMRPFSQRCAIAFDPGRCHHVETCGPEGVTRWSGEAGLSGRLKRPRTVVRPADPRLRTCPIKVKEIRWWFRTPLR